MDYPQYIVVVGSITLGFHYRPVSLWTNSALEFSVPGSSANYIDMRKTRLHIKFKIVKGNGDSLTSSDDVTFVNLPLQALWSQVDIWLGQQQVMNTGVNYPYASYIDLILNNDTEVKETQLQTQLYFKDNAGYFDETSSTKGLNFGLNLRSDFTK